MSKNNKPKAEFNFIKLPRTTLHYVKTGTGSPLIIVPALASKLDQWLPLAQFMGQKFTTYFFELPGHGDSTPYPETFETHFVPKTVEAFLNELEIDRFTLMGFSFGGLLALRTLDYLLPRIDQLILLSPALSKRALLFSTRKQIFLKLLFTVLRSDRMRHGVVNMLDRERAYNTLTTAISKFANIDKQILLSKNALAFPKSTLDVLTASFNEVLRLDYDSENKPFTLPCFYGMSLYDDLLDYEVTLEIVKGLFSNIHVEPLTLPYHQPPNPFTFEEFNSKFGSFQENMQDYIT